MTLTLHPAKLQGEIAAMPSKSDLHRLMIAAWLAGQDITTLPIISDDIAATRDCLLAGNGVLNCRESGSTLRFLLPVMAAIGGTFTFTGEGRLPERPLEPLLTLLRQHGITITSETLPLTISGQLQPGTFTLPGNISSQYITGLLFALPLLPGDSEIVLTSPLESAGYVDMTVRTLEKFGVFVEPSQIGWFIPSTQRYKPATSFAPEGDWSNAAFWLAAGVNIVELDKNSAQPDREIMQLLSSCDPMNAARCPDLVPIMAIYAAVHCPHYEIRNAARLRIKESDRLAAMLTNLELLGADVAPLGDDGMTIRGAKPLPGGATINSFGDHRIAMAMAIAALHCQQPITLTNAEVVAKSYPDFWADYKRLGGIAHGL
ncbi:MAG: 3-phosphoshikimate 1-carboxyvinyltransferase [Oscillospiraceae bacterium]|jgi:3-phosphoshikimate 1-carboxyvinyltransferase|nr:3-phosphoshikimate 1-carboxyvinyltransferase [Oscillospiraceae bacterium]